ncbi:MAG: ImpA family metalloprotease [Pseudomonadota bacterium]
MRKKLGWVSIAILAAACSGGDTEGGASTPATGSTPPTGTLNTAPSILTTEIRTQPGTEISMTLSATDPDGDDITFSKVSGPDWLSLTSNGTVSGSSSADDFGTHELVVDASDGSETTRATINVTLFLDAIEQAFKTGDFTYITEHSDADIQTILQDEIAAVRARNTAAIREIFELNPDGTVAEDSVVGLSWFPSIGFTSHFYPKFPYSFPLLTTNAGGPARHYGILGEVERARFAAFGASPFPNNYEATNPRSRMLKNTIDWLVQTDDDGTLNIMLGHIQEQNDEQNAREWLIDAFGDGVSVRGAGACRGENFATCVNAGADLMIVFQDMNNDGERESVRTAIRDAMQNGVALLHVKKYNEDTGLGADIQAILRGARSDITYPRFTHLDAFSPTDSVYGWEPDLIGEIEMLVAGIQNETHDYDLSVCVDAFTCEENVAFNSEIASGLESLRDHVLDFDRDLRDPFETYYENRFFAALMLTGDYYRSLTTFPMPKASTPSSDIIRALFGDLSVMTNRNTQPVMPDMGVFSRSEFEDVDLGDARITLSGGGPYQTSGLYALPGETFTVTRHDTSSANVKIQINSLSTASGHPFRTIDGSEYNRPVAVNIGPRTLAKAITVAGNNLNPMIEMTSPYGGPIHVYFDSPDEAIDLAFANVARHPVWRGPEDNEAFAIDLVADQFDWAEFVTPRSELHSQIPEMQETLDIARYGNPATLADDMANYFSDWPHWFDGLSGSAIRESDDLASYLEMLEITPQSAFESVTHVTTGSAFCAPPCNAPADELPNRFDPLDPDHQAVLTNTLARQGGLRFSDIMEETMEDLLIMHSQFREIQSNGVAATECQALPHADFYAHVQSGFATGTTARFEPDENWTAADREKAYLIQLMAALEADGALESGWDLWPRVTTIARLYAESSNSLAWHGEPGRKLGFVDITARQASFLPDQALFNTFVAWAAQRDLRPFREAYGYSAPGILSNPVLDNQNLPPLEPAFYAIPETGHCASLAYDELPVDGVSAWPQ